MSTTRDFQRIAIKSMLFEKPRIDNELASQNVSRNFNQDGSTFALNSEGRVIHAEYASGAAVRRHNYYSVARSADGSHWFINRFGLVFALD